VIHVQHGWDEKEDEIETKGKKRRRVPIATALRDYLLEHGLDTDGGVDVDRYGHLTPEARKRAAGLLDSYLTAERKRAEEKAREAGDELTGAQSGAQSVENGANPHG
jgi:integrase